MNLPALKKGVTNTAFVAKLHKSTSNFDNKIATYEKCVNVAKIAQNILEVNLPAQKKCH